MDIIGSLIWQFIKHRRKAIEHFSIHPNKVQETIFRKLIREAQNTEWGTAYGYKEIDRLQTFCDRVPVSSYEDVQPYVQRMLNGETNILWEGRISSFAKSSGTTNSQSKYLPLTPQAIEKNHYQGARDTILFYLMNKPNSSLFTGKTLTLGGSQKVKKSARNIVEGDLSSFLIKDTPFFVDFVRAPKRDIAIMSEWEAKLEAITRDTLHKNITGISGAPAWVLTLFKKVLEVSGKETITEVWPNLEVFMHGGINFEPYREQYKKLIPSPIMSYQEIYNASEGFFAIQSDLTENAMLLMLDYPVFYEFVPLSDIGNPFPKTYTVEEVETNKNYAIIISTACGLWRYMIGDTVMFTSKYPFKIKITGRTKYYINAFGEELIADNAENAIAKACQKMGAVVREYTVAPIFMSSKSKGAHQWLIEFEKQPEDLALFAVELDKCVQEQNSDYEAKRYKSLTMDCLQVSVARKNLFYDWLKLKDKLGGQNKIPRLQNNRLIIDELLNL